MIYVGVEQCYAGTFIVRVSCVSPDIEDYDKLESESYRIEGFKNEIAASVQANIMSNVLLNGGACVTRY
jgi:hypothetical protein